MLEQKVALCDKFSRQKLLAKFWATWRVKFSRSEDFFDTKGKSCNLIWLWKLKDTRKETLRSFVMWRDQVRTEKHRESKLRLRIREKLLNQTDHAFQKWRHYARNLTQQVRLNILVHEFTHDQVLQTTFSQLRIITAEKRRARHHKLRLYIKAWKDSSRYRKFLMAGEVATT